MTDRRIDTTRPSPARMYDYMLGGKNHFAVDVEAAQRVLEVAPESRLLTVVNRQFLERATRYAAGLGIRQFLDIGSGLPTQQNVHQVAQAELPNARTVYVDNDPSVLALAEALIVNDPDTGYVEGDLMTPLEIVDHPTTQRLIDFSQPVAVVLLAVLHFVPPGNDPYGIVRDLMEQVPSGSLLVLSHATTDRINPEVWKRIQENNKNLAVPLNFRPGDDIAKFFDGLDLVAPGFTFIEQWAPGETLPLDTTHPLKLRCGVAMKP
ncbi:SAM-dependent methyltransferase [Sphaerisporangium corydalis]|uniref:SAM-dependent methyltransferase n=1 Tax=Sphaerisporangium corydalis TaxID=1441875 RepID=A0ABV9ELH7_9ACTN|nr:SAM-dependent methyltransferase [Sphaerisporangium corydalis]